MDKFNTLFSMSDKAGPFGFLMMWLSFFLISFVTLLADHQTGPIRDYCAASQLVCTTNLVVLGYAVANNVKWSKVSLLTCGFDMFATWLALAYYREVFDSSILGVWNVISTIFMGVFTVVYLASVITVARDHAGFRKYLEEDQETNEA